MRFSILIPTRNRLEYLRLAVESVLRQGFQDWQIVISDNFSEQDIGAYVASLSDPRVICRRTERPVPVTENWNRALAFSEGEYVLMLGDDDAIVDGYLERMDALAERFESPDLIYTKSLLFTYPGVDPRHPGGSLMEHGCASFFAGANAPFVLDRAQAVDVVRGAMAFRLRFDFNAQFALISRGLISSLGEYGDFYQSEFPDYYSMNAAFLQAGRILVDPQPGPVIGVTPKSYGFFHANGREAEGREFLEGSPSAGAVGTNINVGWLSAMDALERGPARELGLGVDRRRYRLVQAAYAHERYRAGAISVQELRRLERELPPAERYAYRLASSTIGFLQRHLPAGVQDVRMRLTQRLLGQIPPVAQPPEETSFQDILDVVRGRPGAQALR
jgi:hypothetical protein